MEKQLTRIADAFESIAASLNAIHNEGLELWSSDLSIELRNASHGTKTIPFKVQP